MDVGLEEALVATWKTRKWSFLPELCELSEELMPANASQVTATGLCVPPVDSGRSLIRDGFSDKEDRGVGATASDITASSSLLSSSSESTLMEMSLAGCFPVGAVGGSETARRVCRSVRDQISEKREERATDNLVAYTAPPFSPSTANNQVVAIDKGSAEYGIGECELF